MGVDSENSGMTGTVVGTSNTFQSTSAMVRRGWYKNKLVLIRLGASEALRMDTVTKTVTVTLIQLYFLWTGGSISRLV
eukprot:1565250-Rhodomonas_salina.1